MKPIEKAARFFECLGTYEKDEQLKEFDVEDTFNSPNTLQGFMCRISDYRYGAMYITSVCNIPCAPQIVWGSPKQQYPFGRDGRFNWPKMRKVNIYEKLDGTCITAYSYTFKKKRFVTYKTRLTPVARHGKWGDFRGMWLEMLEKYPVIPGYVLEHKVNLSFELYGARNLHLIVYDIPLDTKLLFATPQTVAPGVIDPESLHDLKGLPPIVWGNKCTALNDLTSYYKKRQAEAEAALEMTDMGFKGGEGFVLYAHLVDGRVQQLKLKPETIEKIHWSGGLGKNTIKATVINAFENEDDVTVDFVKQLLREEFEPAIINGKTAAIAEILGEVKAEMLFRKEVVEVYKSLGVSVAEDKAAAMRALSEHFDKKIIRYVYWIVTHC
jgi:hypothetical protein